MTVIAGLDMYRKIPAELLEGTKRGSVLSIVSLMVMATLIVLETKSYLTSTTVTDLKLDTSNKEVLSRVTFNITFMGLRCDFISIDQVSVFGTEQNIRNTVTKRSIDEDGVHQFYKQTNNDTIARKLPKEEKRGLDLYDATVTETLEELHKNGEDAIFLTPETFETVLKDNEFVFVDFYASWCSHCRDLLPTWETLAELMNKAPAEVVKRRIMKNHKELEKQMMGGHDNVPLDLLWTPDHLQHAESGLKAPVVIAKVDCVEFSAFCFQNHLIMAYPTLRLFVKGEVFGGDFYGHRTVLDFTDYLATVEEQYMPKENGGLLQETHELSKDLHKIRAIKAFAYEDEMGNPVDYYGYYEDSGSRPSRFYAEKIMDEWIEKDHPGCEISGYLLIDRVPGNFHIFARSEEHDLVPQMTNLSHHVNLLTFEDHDNGPTRMDMNLNQKVHALDNGKYVTENLHEAYHHYIKLVSTHPSDNDKQSNRRVYQMVVKSQIAYYKSDVTPTAKFQWDYSPVSVTYLTKNRKWYDYITSLLAIVGGMFTTIGMLEGSLYAMSRKKRI